MPGLRELVSAIKKHEGKTLLPLIDRALLARNHMATEVEGLVHPSAVGNVDDICPREIFFARYTPVEKYPKGLLAEVSSARHHRIFDNGDFVHLRLFLTMIEAGIVDPRRGTGWEIPVGDPDFGMIGHADCIAWPEAQNQIRVKKVRSGHGDSAYPVMNADGTLQWEGEFKPAGEPVLVDIKSIWHHGTQRFPGFTMLHCALPKHRSQVICYTALLRKKYMQLKRALILYESKESQELKEFEVPFNATTWAKVRVPLLKVNRCREHKVLPNGICKSSFAERAVECDWAKMCFSTTTFSQLVQVAVPKADAKSKAVNRRRSR